VNDPPADSVIHRGLRNIAQTTRSFGSFGYLSTSEGDFSDCLTTGAY
jgi:hypothetical protein